MKRLLVNDCLSALPDHRTFWNDLQDWFEMEFVGGDYAELAETANKKAWPVEHFTEEGYLCGVGGPMAPEYSLIIRNASYFGPLEVSKQIPTISLVQDIFDDGAQRGMQVAVVKSSSAIVFNSKFTRSKLTFDWKQHPVSPMDTRIIPLPVDFSLFEPGNALGLQQALSLPDNCVCWIGASQGAAGNVKNWQLFLSIVRRNPDLPFVAVFKDAPPNYGPPNLRMLSRITHKELVKIIGACRIGLCTSKIESQHLAGIEMGACGLPMIAPPVGTYYERDDIPGVIVGEQTPEAYTTAIRATLSNPGDPHATRAYWKREFDRPIIKAAWTKLIEEVECSGRS